VLLADVQVKSCERAGDQASVGAAELHQEETHALFSDQPLLPPS